MAEKKVTTKEEPKSNVMAQNQTAAPEGWEKEQTGFPPYWSPTEGATFRGVITGFDPDRENDGAFPRFTIRATSPLLCHQGPVDDQTDAPIAVGELFNVSSYATLPLQEYMGVEVWAKAVNKRSIDGGKTLWNFELRVSPETKKMLAARAAKQLEEANAAIPS